MEADKNPILLDFPESFESERLLIRSPLRGDGAAVNAAIVESAERLRPWMPWVRTVPTLEESEIHARQAWTKFMERKDLPLFLFLKETGQFIGGSGLHRIDWEARRFEIGYWLRTSMTGQGYMREAVDAITDFAIHELEANRIEIRCDTRNTKSAAVARHLGFTLEGVLRKNGTDCEEGQLRDTMVFAKVRGVEYGAQA
jgi:RimJ/RimL family protein N-acetyltransferase